MHSDLKEQAAQPPEVNEGGNGLSNKTYSIAMARTPHPDSATSQFFIKSNDNLFLDRARAHDGFGYAVFGDVPDAPTVIGAAIIVAGGLYAFHRERVRSSGAR